MEAARVAALRGHEVILYDKKPYLGGGLPLAALVKGTELEDFPAFVRYFKGQLKKLGVQVKLRTAVDESVVKKIKPDVIIVAAGGVGAIPEIPGIHGRNVSNITSLYRILEFMIWALGPNLSRRLSQIWMPIGKRVVVIGGHFPGCELVEYMVKTGRQATLVEKSPAIGEGLVSDQPYRLYKWFDKKGVERLTGVKYKEVTPKGLTVITRECQERHCEADTVMPAPILTPNRTLYQKLQGTAPEVYLIGDAHEQGLTHHAISEGAAIARRI
jgi:2,4-dienoyl-CoA reductase (NADPH2)